MEEKVDDALFDTQVQHEIDQRFCQQAVSVPDLSHCLFMLGSHMTFQHVWSFGNIFTQFALIFTSMNSYNMLIQVFFAG